MQKAGSSYKAIVNKITDLKQKEIKRTSDRKFTIFDKEQPKGYTMKRVISKPIKIAKVKKKESAFTKGKKLKTYEEIVTKIKILEKERDSILDKAPTDIINWKEQIDVLILVNKIETKLEMLNWFLGGNSK